MGWEVTYARNWTLRFQTARNDRSRCSNCCFYWRNDINILSDKEDKIKIGDLVFDKGLKQKGLVIEVLNSVVPYRVFYDDGHIDIACDHDLELIDGYLV